MTDDYTIQKGDAFQLVKTLGDNSIALAITSPPYNVGKSYEKQVDLESYLKPYQQFARDLYKKITPTGSLCWQVGNFVDAGEVYPLDVFYYQISIVEEMQEEKL